MVYLFLFQYLSITSCGFLKHLKHRSNVINIDTTTIITNVHTYSGVLERIQRILGSLIELVRIPRRQLEKISISWVFAII